jgi:hypothetical protein
MEHYVALPSMVSRTYLTNFRLSPNEICASHPISNFLSNSKWEKQKQLLLSIVKSNLHKKSYVTSTLRISLQAGATTQHFSSPP